MSGLTTGSFVIGVFNALAFTGTSFLFRQLDNSGYQKEMRRHNLALEKLATAKEKWFENQEAKKDRIEKLRREKLDADKDIAATNRALLELRKITHEGIIFTKEPKISDFYKPSTEMKELTHVVTGAGGFGLGFLLTKMLFL